MILLALGQDAARARYAQAWRAVNDEFGLAGRRSMLARLDLGCGDHDDIAIERRCEAIERALGIHLELPFMGKTIGDLVDAIARALARKEAA